MVFSISVSRITPPCANDGGAVAMEAQPKAMRNMIIPKRFNDLKSHFVSTVSTVVRQCNRSFVSIGFVLLLSACGVMEIPNPIAKIKKFIDIKSQVTSRRVFGVIAGDEPAAVAVGNNILLQGGNAADAAVAMGFAMSVTYPSRAGLGGGGVCVLADGRKGEVKILDFLPQLGRARGKYTDRPSAIPAFARGMASLNLKYGTLSWQSLLRPARTLARDGFIVSKPFSADLKKYAKPLFADPISREVFSNDQGEPVKVGERVKQLHLHSVLSSISGRGAGEIYNGVLSQRLVSATRSAGGSLSTQQLRQFLPTWRKAISVQIGGNIFHTSPPPAIAGIVAIQMLQMAHLTDGSHSAPFEKRITLILESAKSILTGRQRWIGDDYGRSAEAQRLVSARYIQSFVKPNSGKGGSSISKNFDSARHVDEIDASVAFSIVDGDGLVVNCALTMYHPFGTGRMASGLGILLAAAPGEGGRNPLPLGPVVVTRASDNAVRFVFSSSGGEKSSTALGNVMINSIFTKMKLKDVVNESRLHYRLKSEEFEIEPLKDHSSLVSLASLGHKVRSSPNIGLVNVISCPEGLPSPKPHCDVEVDQRGGGISAIINFDKPER